MACNGYTTTTSTCTCVTTRYSLEASTSLQLARQPHSIALPHSPTVAATARGSIPHVQHLVPIHKLWRRPVERDHHEVVKRVAPETSAILPLDAVEAAHPALAGSIIRRDAAIDAGEDPPVGELAAKRDVEERANLVVVARSPPTGLLGGTNHAGLDGGVLGENSSQNLVRRAPLGGLVP